MKYMPAQIIFGKKIGKKREKYSMNPRTKSNEIKCIENTSPKHKK
jgi:hypothetical protein